MPFLGIDQSLTATGLCLVDDAGKVLLMETVDPGKRRDGERLSFIRDRIREHLAPGVSAAMEGYAYDATNKPFLLGEVGGVVKMTLFEGGIPLIVIAPVALKKFATSDHRAKKEKVISRAQQLGADPQDDNQADAFFLARAAWLSTFDVQGAFDHGANRSQLEVLETAKNKKRKVGKRIRTLVKNSL